MQSTPRSNRLHIAIFGRRNAGKSSLINALTNQDIALVSNVPGTTTDPVYKAMEILPVGPVVIIDTAGLDDTGELGELRVQQTRQVLAKSDLAIVVVDATRGVGDYERSIAAEIRERGIPVIGVANKMDLASQNSGWDAATLDVWGGELALGLVPVSSKTGQGIGALKDDIGRVKIPAWLERKVDGRQDFSWSAGTGFPDDLGSFDLVVHCGRTGQLSLGTGGHIRIAKGATYSAGCGALLDAPGANREGPARRALVPRCRNVAG
ncbi:MAG: 50S ribosome-binding GTPase [Bacillota bacterium]|nr:50S ribosome-binding GTPase [Bacillota bacterium]